MNEYVGLVSRGKNTIDVHKNTYVPTFTCSITTYYFS